MPPLYSI